MKCRGFLWIYISIGQIDLNEILGLNNNYLLLQFCISSIFNCFTEKKVRGFFCGPCEFKIDKDKIPKILQKNKNSYEKDDANHTFFFDSPCSLKPKTQFGIFKGFAHVKILPKRDEFRKLDEKWELKKEKWNKDWIPIQYNLTWLMIMSLSII